MSRARYSTRAFLCLDLFKVLSLAFLECEETFKCLCGSMARLCLDPTHVSLKHIFLVIVLDCGEWV